MGELLKETPVPNSSMQQSLCANLDIPEPKNQPAFDDIIETAYQLAETSAQIQPEDFPAQEGQLAGILDHIEALACGLAKHPSANLGQLSEKVAVFRMVAPEPGEGLNSILPYEELLESILADIDAAAEE